jgi:hypothetical protein
MKAETIKMIEEMVRRIVREELEHWTPRMQVTGRKRTVECDAPAGKENPQRVPWGGFCQY